MAAITRVGIVYSTSQQIIRRIIHVDDDSQIPIHNATVVQGESWAVIPISDYNSITSHQGIHDYLGLTGISCVTDRMAVVDKHGNVIAITCADPAIDAHPAGTLTPHTLAVVGDTIINGIYTPVVANAIAAQQSISDSVSDSAAS